MSSRGLVAIVVLAGLLIVAALVWRHEPSRPSPGPAPAVVVEKQPVAVATHEFDPAAPPSNLPQLAPGESAVCVSDFLSTASVRGDSLASDATHATSTISHIRMTLQLKIDIWLPAGASPHLAEHEEGHRQISEYYYQTADKVAEHIAGRYLDRRVDVTGTDLDAASRVMLQQLAAEITSEYGKELNPGPTQLLFDSITDHGRNGVVATDGVAHAIKNAPVEAAGPANP